MAEIAIFSTSIDEPTYGPVVERLNSRGYKPWVYNADLVANGKDQFSMIVSQTGELVLKHQGVIHQLDEISSAWFRHPNIPSIDIEDKASQFCIEQEITSLQESIWQQIPDDAWLNHPGVMKKAQTKLAQLVLAKDIGFTIPTTTVSNTWGPIDEIYEDKDVIAKMSKGLLVRNNRAQVVYTSRLNFSARQKLSQNNPYPAIYQPFLTKHREWRSTVVGENIFSSSIYTKDDATIDWRQYQLTDKVVFKSEKLPERETERCFEFLRRLGLVYGAFDFIEDDSGAITFLECNTNGQYRWLEDSLGLPISDAITEELINLHRQNSI